MATITAGSLTEPEKELIQKMSAPVDASTIFLASTRLTLRPVRKEDLEDLYVLLSDEAVAGPSGFPLCTTLEAAQDMVQTLVDDNETLVLEEKETGMAIGTISIQRRLWGRYPIDQAFRGRELGFDLARGYWGRGLMPEAVRMVCDYCFRELDYDFVTCGYFLANAQSARVIEKCGFEFLFQAEHQLPTGRREEIATYICYNPRLRRNDHV